jgi:hypothetical protein
MRIAIALLMLVGCGENLDSVMWGCQLEIQKGNAGKSGEALTEKARDIERCMEGRGYQRDGRNRSCLSGTTNSACYQRK